jgi:hypothetical protein
MIRLPGVAGCVVLHTYQLYRLPQIFESDSEEVQREWVKYTIKVDKRMEDALR